MVFLSNPIIDMGSKIMKIQCMDCFAVLEVEFENIVREEWRCPTCGSFMPNLQFNTKIKMNPGYRGIVYDINEEDKK